jgi:hypothetical protein
MAWLVVGVLGVLCVIFFVNAFHFWKELASAREAFFMVYEYREWLEKKLGVEWKSTPQAIRKKYVLGDANPVEKAERLVESIRRGQEEPVVRACCQERGTRNGETAQYDCDRKHV